MDLSGNSLTEQLFPTMIGSTDNQQHSSSVLPSIQIHTIGCAACFANDNGVQQELDYIIIALS